MESRELEDSVEAVNLQAEIKKEEDEQETLSAVRQKASEEHAEGTTKVQRAIKARQQVRKVMVEGGSEEEKRAAKYEFARTSLELLEHFEKQLEKGMLGQTSEQKRLELKERIAQEQKMMEDNKPDTP